MSVLLTFTTRCSSVRLKSDGSVGSKTKNIIVIFIPTLDRDRPKVTISLNIDIFVMIPRPGYIVYQLDY